MLAGHPGVAEVAVTGTPSDEWGEVVTAWIVPDGVPPSAGELAEFVAPLLAAYKRPRLVRVVGALPRNAMGKVDQEPDRVMSADRSRPTGRCRSGADTIAGCAVDELAAPTDTGPGPRAGLRGT